MAERVLCPSKDPRQLGGRVRAESEPSLGSRGLRSPGAAVSSSIASVLAEPGGPGWGCHRGIPASLHLLVPWDHDGWLFHWLCKSRVSLSCRSSLLRCIVCQLYLNRALKTKLSSIKKQCIYRYINQFNSDRNESEHINHLSKLERIKLAGLNRNC